MKIATKREDRLWAFYEWAVNHSQMPKVKYWDIEHSPLVIVAEWRLYLFYSRRAAQ